MLDILTEPFELAFMQRAFLAAGFAAVACAVVGTYVVLKGLGFMGDAIAHSSLTGMAAAVALGGNVLWGALAWVFPASLAITFISRNTRLLMDTSIGIVYAAGFSIGLIILSFEPNYTRDLLHFLFGNVVDVSWGEVIAIGAVAGAVLAVVLLLFKELTFTAYDDTMASASGVPVRAIQYLLPLLIGITTVAALKTVGIVLVLSLLVTPAATARLLVTRLANIMGAAVVLALASVVAGLHLAFHLDTPPGPTIVLVSTGLFVLTLVFSPSRGLIKRRRRRAADL
jgi:manganese/iron transport system permease protein